MTEKSGFLGLGAAGGVAAGAATLAVLVAVLYSTGLLAPADDPSPEQVEAAAPAPEQPEVEDATADTADPAPTATASETAEETQEAEPVAEAPASDPLEEAPSTDPAPDTDTANAEPAGEDAGDPVAQEQAQTTPEEPAEPVAEEPLMAPRFDVVRAAPDGTTVIAGQAASGSTVQILVDGEVADTQSVNGQGEFASLLLLPPSAQARVLTLLSTDGSREVASAEEIILAPSPAPQVAATDPDVASEPETTAEQDVASVAQDNAADSDAATPTATESADETPTQTALADPVEPQVAETEPDAEPATAEATQSNEPAAVAVLRADQDGVELVQPATPTPDVAPDQVTLDTIGYSPEGDVLLSGRAPADTLIRIYLDNSALADVTSDAAGRWRARLDGIDPGVYALRLDALSNDGTVLSRIETPFKRESPEALASAQPDVEPQAEPAPISQVTVQAGDTLWAISRDRYGDGLLYVRVFEANRNAIRDPDLIYPGQIFTIPE